MRLFLAGIVVVDHATRLALGAWAVSVFFCLSGYWITVMYRGKYSKYSRPAVAFYLSRYLRLLPVYIVCQLIMIGALAYIHAPLVLHGVGGIIWSLRTLAIVTSSSQVVYLGPSWSLDIEVQFYILFPLLWYCVLKVPEVFRAKAIFALAILLMLITIHSTGRESFIYYYVGFFLLGVSNALKPWKPAKFVGLGSAVLFFVLVSLCVLVPGLRGFILGGAHPLNPTQFTYNHSLCSILTLVFYPYVCYTLSFRSTTLDKHLGNLAYPIYLFHWVPQILICGNVFQWPLGRIELTVIHLVVTAIGGVSIYLLLDRPVDNIRENFIQRTFGVKKEAEVS